METNRDTRYVCTRIACCDTRNLLTPTDTHTSPNMAYMRMINGQRHKMIKYYLHEWMCGRRVVWIGLHWIEGGPSSCRRGEYLFERNIDLFASSVRVRVEKTLNSISIPFLLFSRTSHTNTSWPLIMSSFVCSISYQSICVIIYRLAFCGNCHTGQNGRVERFRWCDPDIFIVTKLWVNSAHQIEFRMQNQQQQKSKKCHITQARA